MLSISQPESHMQLLSDSSFKLHFLHLKQEAYQHVSRWLPHIRVVSFWWFVSSLDSEIICFIHSQSLSLSVCLSVSMFSPTLLPLSSPPPPSLSLSAPHLSLFLSLSQGLSLIKYDAMKDLSCSDICGTDLFQWTPNRDRAQLCATLCFIQEWRSCVRGEERWHAPVQVTQANHQHHDNGVGGECA